MCDLACQLWGQTGDAGKHRVCHLSLSSPPPFLFPTPGAKLELPRGAGVEEQGLLQGPDAHQILGTTWWQVISCPESAGVQSVIAWEESEARSYCPPLANYWHNESSIKGQESSLYFQNRGCLVLGSYVRRYLLHNCSFSFHSLVNKYLLDSYYVPNPVLDAR